MTDILEALGNDDNRPHIEGKRWAPGYYTCNCFNCGKPFMGAKRASECAPCAYEDNEKQVGHTIGTVTCKLGDFDRWFKPCKCGYDSAKAGKNSRNRCWKCGTRLSLDFSERALKVNARVVKE